MNSETQTNQDGVESQVIDELLETLEDGRLGFIDAAEKLAAAGRPQWADTFGALAAQRAAMADELQQAARDHGVNAHDDRRGSILAGLHRGWMTVKDATAGTSPAGVLDVAIGGEGRAIHEFAFALDTAGVPAELLALIGRERAAIIDTQTALKTLRASIT